MKAQEISRIEQQLRAIETLLAIKKWKVSRLHQEVNKLLMQNGQDEIGTRSYFARKLTERRTGFRGRIEEVVAKLCQDNEIAWSSAPGKPNLLIDLEEKIHLALPKIDEIRLALGESELHIHCAKNRLSRTVEQLVTQAIALIKLKNKGEAIAYEIHTKAAVPIKTITRDDLLEIRTNIIKSVEAILELPNEERFFPIQPVSFAPLGVPLSEVKINNGLFYSNLKQLRRKVAKK